MTDTKRRAIERKIEHLLRIAASATGAEAETAMQHARRLMLQWNVTEDELGHEKGYMRRLVWTGKQRPVWFDYVLYLVHNHFFARGIMSRQWQLDDPAGPVYGPGKWMHSTELFASEGNIAVACYAWAVLSREFRDQLRRQKPKAQRAFCVGVARTIHAKFAADQRGLAATSEGREVIISPRALHQKVDDALACEIPDLKDAKKRKTASVADYDAQRAGERGAAAFEFRRPLPGQEPATLTLGGPER